MARAKKVLDLESSSSSSSSSAPSSSSDDESIDSNTARDTTDIDNKNKNDNDSDSDSNDNKLIINAKYAKEYDKRKRRQELTNLRQKKNDDDSSVGSDDSSSSEESEDEDGELLTPKVDLQILKTINALRKKDDSIYNPETKFFTADDQGISDPDGEEKKKKPKRKLYKDIVRDEIMKKMENDDDGDEHGVFDDDDDDNANRGNRGINNDHARNSRDNIEKLAYDDEQIALRSAFLSSGGENVHENESSDDENDSDSWLKKKVRNNIDETDDQVEQDRLKEIEALVNHDINSSSGHASKLKDPKGEVEDGDKFLFDFIKNKRWVDHETFNHEDDGDDNDNSDNENNGLDTEKLQEYDSDSSLHELNKTDDFESRFNFRFEEANNGRSESGAALSVVGYSRSSLSDTVRRKDETRKKRRKERKERKLAERKVKEEKLKRLKNAKKEELEDRIKQIKSVLTDKAAEMPNEVVNEELVAKLMEGDFDSDKFEDLMSKMYSEDFYEQEDSEWKTDADVKESFKKSNLREDQDILTSIDEDEDEDEDAYNDDVEDYNQENLGDDEDDDTHNDAHNELEYDDDGKSDNGLEKKLKERMMDELYKLDYEDIIGDMPTRFKYRKVEPNRYGLRPEEILFSRDTTLKNFVSLKRMAPYDDQGEYVPGTKRRKRFRDMAKADFEDIMNEEDYVEENDTNFAEDSDKLQKKKRRRQKKGKKKNSSQVDQNVEEEDQKANADEADTINDNGSIPSDKKRGRKKKGKKKKKVSDIDGVDEAKSNLLGSKRAMKTKKKKKGDKKDSLSEARLASYNL
eukprot:CAMPEP_0203683190 /NCGR_PEP_ID=MMETSP0090-20130426/47391_1 /ASSEMBLY_ACC=CAM_ASM_001088 /TAXON_ID=426623 /ORGANISM="Chaetoceros affinis, Strain CCMP159" /LENGTH=802 /DNA_ID=CAMNT_0050552319 /DNA_START=44 /DNA_END=2452 /DNA_ORIENTATION=-